jgi:hypothetical protein
MADGGRITHADAELSEALLQLQLIGLLRRPPEEGWGVPCPGYLSTPSVLRRY